MARIKRAVNAQKKKRKMMKLAKGYFGAKSKQYRAASEQVRRSLRYAYIGRKLKKRNFRNLWIARINAAARVNGLSYSRLRCSPSWPLQIPRRSPHCARRQRKQSKYLYANPRV